VIKLETGCTLTMTYDDGSPPWVLPGHSVQQILFIKKYLGNTSPQGIVGKLEIYTWGWKAFLHFGSKSYLLARISEAFPPLS
jgi:hypothetical protein